ncbi:MAG: response regulator [Actinomycetota bacterium]|nr:response regulator [Actinomycetota bacterium]
MIDDDAVIVQLLRVNFEMDDYEVSTALDGQTGLDSAIDRPPDVILLDVMMPHLDGLEVARRLRAHEATAGVPIVFLSAKAQSNDVLAGEALANVYVTKPFDPLELLEEVAALLSDPEPDPAPDPQPQPGLQPKPGS